jgi:hypothetical protein
VPARDGTHVVLICDTCFANRSRKQQWLRALDPAAAQNWEAEGQCLHEAAHEHDLSYLLWHAGIRCLCLLSC